MARQKPKPILVRHNEKLVDLLDFVAMRRREGRDDKYIAAELNITPTILEKSIERAKQNGQTLKEERRLTRSEKRAEKHRELVEKVLDLSDKNLENVTIAKELGVNESVVVNVIKKYRP